MASARYPLLQLIELHQRIDAALDARREKRCAREQACKRGWRTRQDRRPADPILNDMVEF